MEVFKVKKSESEIFNLINTVESDFCFLFVGHWLQGEISQDRKDVGMLIKTFIETFKSKGKPPALILKTSGATYSIMDREVILKKIDAIKSSYNNSVIPNIYLIHGDLTDIEMNELYNHPKIKAHISFTKGEGFGRPLLEASISAKPVIAPNYSGQVDFLSPNSQLLPGQMTQIHPSAVHQGMLNADTQWFTVNYGYASQLMKHVFEKYDEYTDKARKQAFYSRSNFSLDKMGEVLLNILDSITKHIPRQMKLQLPKLKKIETSELPEIKKVEA